MIHCQFMMWHSLQDLNYWNMLKSDTKMRIGIAADHGGYELKMQLAAALIQGGYDFVDYGAYEYDKDDDYPDLVVPRA